LIRLGPHLHSDKGQKGPNPLRDLIDVYTASPSGVNILSPSRYQIAAGNIPIAEPDDADDFSMTVEEPAPQSSLLDRGMSGAAQNLLEAVNEHHELRPVDFSPEIAAETPLLIVPSGGLYGLENSEIFKVALSEYVKNGGTLLVFAQQHGYEYSALPAPVGKPTSAYGWTEDQSCRYRSSYIDTWHQMLSSLNLPALSINVDGYFTSCPENSTVLLRRTRNGQPAAIMYPYGQGYVIATTFYTDFGAGMSQARMEEKAIA